MHKTIKIFNCIDCFHRKEDNSISPPGATCSYGENTIKLDPDNIDIPFFCPIEDEEEIAKVGVSVFIVNEKNQFLVGLRNVPFGYNTYGLPGGKLRKGEDIIAGAKREVKEEVNLDIDNLVEVGFENNIYPEKNLHYVTLFYFTRCYNGKLKNMEYPEKCLELKWIDYKNPPALLFSPLCDILKHKESLLNELFERR